MEQMRVNFLFLFSINIPCPALPGRWHLRRWVKNIFGDNFVLLSFKSLPSFWYVFTLLYENAIAFYGLHRAGREGCGCFDGQPEDLTVRKKLFVTLFFWDVLATATLLTPPTPLPVSSTKPGAVVLDAIDVYGKRGNQAHVIDPLRNRLWKV